MIVLAEQGQARELTQSLAGADVPSAERYRQVVRHLQDIAEATQPPVLEKLKELNEQGQITAFRSFFVANCIAVEGTVLLGRKRTNNYGELYGCLLALRVAGQLGSRHVFGDSRLVLDFWSRGHVAAEMRARDPELAALAALVRTARAAFERGGGALAHIPGGTNPADLGHHRD